MAPQLESQGWEVERTNKASVRMRKRKPPSHALEDDVWTLLARVGFPELNAGRQFTIPIANTPGAPSKQIDVLAADNETILDC